MSKSRIRSNLRALRNRSRSTIRNLQGLFVNPYVTRRELTSIGLERIPFNGGEAQYSGLDLNANYHVDLGFGNFNASWTGTYMLKQQYTNGPGLPELTDLGAYRPRSAGRVSNHFESRAEPADRRWVNTLMTHYKSGYRDETYSAGNAVVFSANPDGTLGRARRFRWPEGTELHDLRLAECLQHREEYSFDGRRQEYERQGTAPVIADAAAAATKRDTTVDTMTPSAEPFMFELT